MKTKLGILIVKYVPCIFIMLLFVSPRPAHAVLSRRVRWEWQRPPLKFSWTSQRLRKVETSQDMQKFIQFYFIEIRRVDGIVRDLSLNNATDTVLKNTQFKTRVKKYRSRTHESFTTGNSHC